MHVANAIKDADAAFQYYSMIEESMEGLSKEEKEDSKKTGTYPTRSAGDYLTLRGIFAALEREITVDVRARSRASEERRNVTFVERRVVHI